MHTKSISELLVALQRGEFSARELTSHFLDRINTLEPHYNSFITLLPEQALQAATRSDQLRAKGEAQLLCGIPIVHKDIFCTKGIRTTCGSRILHDFVSPYDATVVEKLNQAGVVVLGKTNMDEFAMGSSSETSYYGNVHNPWDLERVPGGSSGGSAVAVAARLCVAATGSDTGGSVRQPAALCGITGFKPTYGRISRWGMIAYASSLDQAGTLTRSAEDAALLLNAMAGHDHRDSTSIAANVPDYTAELDGKTSRLRSTGQRLAGLRIGLCKEYFEDGLDAAVGACVQEGIAELEKLGATVSEVSLANIKQAIPAYYVIAPAECSANLARYDGVRFGYRCENPSNLEDLYKRSRSEGFGREVKRRIMVGTFVLSAGYYDAYYRKAQQIRRLIKNDFSSAFDQVDILVGPTTPTPAFKIGAKSEDQIAMYLQDIFTIACNLAGLPAASIPVGFVDGLPVGMQLIGNYLQEATILRVAHQFQLQTDWHVRLPATAA